MKKPVEYWMCMAGEQRINSSMICAVCVKEWSLGMWVNGLHDLPVTHLKPLFLHFALKVGNFNQRKFCFPFCEIWACKN